MHRRDFLLKAAGLAAASRAMPHLTPASSARLPLRKAVKLSMVQEDLPLVDTFRLLKELGFDGVELDSPNDFDTADVLAARDEADFPIHGVVDSVHWRQPLSDPDPAVRQAGLDGLMTALQDAHDYGASTVLLVPAVVKKEVSYADAYTRSQAEIRKALPMAEALGVRIALENVWNHFLLSPLEMARYIDAFDSPWIGAYFDIGNVVTYGWPEHWIRILGPRILKLDVKEYSRRRRDADGLWEGFKVELGEGDCDWPAVRAALADIGYRGWATAEVPGGGRARLADIAARMDQVLALGG